MALQKKQSAVLTVEAKRLLANTIHSVRSHNRQQENKIRLNQNKQFAAHGLIHTKNK